jgi:gluconate kinase
VNNKKGIPQMILLHPHKNVIKIKKMDQGDDEDKDEHIDQVQEESNDQGRR